MKPPDVAPDISYIPDEKNPSNCVSFLFFINQLKVDLLYCARDEGEIFRHQWLQQLQCNGVENIPSESLNLAWVDKNYI